MSGAMLPITGDRLAPTYHPTVYPTAPVAARKAMTKKNQARVRSAVLAVLDVGMFQPPVCAKRRPPSVDNPLGGGLQKRF